MPSQASANTKDTRRGPDPVTASTEALLTQLAADPVVGLSPKEAERRLSKSTAAPLFIRPPSRYRDCLKEIVREPALWMLLAVSIIALFFDRIALGAVCALLTAGNAALCAYFLRRVDMTESAMAAYDAPLCRVLRGGRVIRLGADQLVEGDVILLYPGDIVPADCRLLRSKGLTVLERELDATDSSAPPLRLRKSAEAIPSARQKLRASPENMVFAGGIVEEGEALALVIAVGSDTHLGGLMGRLPSARRGRIPDSFRRAARLLSACNLCLFCLSVPLTVVGIFTLGDKYDFLDIFLSALTPVTLILTEHILAKGYYVASIIRRSAARDRDRASAADVRSTAVCERLTDMTDLLLVGTAALHDGQSHPETLRMGDTVYHCDRPEADDGARAVAEYLYVYRRAMAGLPSAGYGREATARFIPELCDWAEIDTDGLLARVEELRAEGDAVLVARSAPEGVCRIRILLTERFRDTETCTQFYEGDSVRRLDDEGRNRLYRVCREAMRRGSRVAFLILEEEGERTLRAVVTYAAHTDRRTAGCIRGLERAGIRVTAFLRDESLHNVRALAACGLTDTMPADRPAAEGNRVPAAARMEAGCRAFVGCDGNYIEDCIRELKAKGRTVGVLSVDGEDLSLLAEADIAFTCVPSLYAAAEGGAVRFETGEPREGDGDPDGLPDARIATDRARRCAHVLVRRSSAGGGGVLGARQALLTADRCRESLERGLRFILLSQTVRLLVTVLPLCLGLAVAVSPALLLSGLGLDLLVLLAYIRLPARDIPASRRTSELSLSALWRIHRAELISAAVGAALPWGILGIAALAGASFGGDLLYVALLSTVALQLAFFRADYLPRRDRTVFLTALAMALVYVGSLAASLAGGLGLIWALLIPPVAPAGYLLTRLILTRIVGLASPSALRRAG